MLVRIVALSVCPAHTDTSAETTTPLVDIHVAAFTIDWSKRSHYSRSNAFLVHPR